MELANPVEEEESPLKGSQKSKPQFKAKIESEIPLNFQKIYQILIERSEKKLSLTMFNKSIKNIKALRQKKAKPTDKLQVVFIAGSYGSGKKKFAEFLKK